MVHLQSYFSFQIVWCNYISFRIFILYQQGGHAQHSRPSTQQPSGSAIESAIQQLTYACVNIMTFSDHYAVHALFCLQVPL